MLATIQLYKGRDITLRHQYFDPSTGAPLSIAGFTITGKLKKSRNHTDALITLTSLGVSPDIVIVENGLVDIGIYDVTFAAADTLNLPSDYYFLGYSFQDSDGLHPFGECGVELITPVDLAS